jgi:methylamine utilization protein MauE
VLELYASVAALVALGVMSYSALAHARRLGSFADMVREQSVVARPLSTAIAVTVTGIEALVGGSGLLLVWLHVGDGAPLRVALIAVGCTYLVFAAYAAFLWRRRPGAPCACSGSSEPANAWTVARTSVLAGTGFFASVFAGTVLGQGLSFAEAMIVTFSAIAIGIMLWSYPDALHDPAELRLRLAMGRLR